MAQHNCTILVADDDKYIRDDLGDLLGSLGGRILFSATAQETWRVISDETPDLVLLDIKFPDCADLSLLRRIKQETATEVVILTSQAENVPQIVEAIKLGAFDYVPKPFVGAELINRIEKALAQRQLCRAQEYFVRELESENGLDCLVGASPAMVQIRETIRRLAATDGCVLVRGESGTGKELAARALHFLSQRRAKPFVAVNCAAIPEALVESVLFGHRRGAFTGAVESAKGRFEAAEDGTLFLDEVGDMPLAQQASLLRVLEYRRYTPVGETKERECKARFVLATNRDLKECVRRGTLREDLYYRINVAAFTMPPLRSRPQDTPELIQYFLAKLSASMGRGAAGVNAEALALLGRYDWPGNVRELKHVLEGALMLLDPQRRELTVRDLPPELLAAGADDAADGPGHNSLDRQEKEDLIRALRESGGNQTQAARLLGCHRNTIRSRVRYFGIGGLEEH